MKDIIVICNSEEALKCISSGLFSGMQYKDIFTCNDGYTFFRTNGKHFNMMVDKPQIKRFVDAPAILHADYQKKIFFIFSPFNGGNESLKETFPHLTYSPVSVGASSGLNCLFFINRELMYDVIYLVGHTFTEFNFDTMPKDKSRELNYFFDLWLEELGSQQAGVRKFIRKQ